MKKRLLLVSPIVITSIANVAMNMNDSIDKKLHKNGDLTYVADSGVVNDINKVQASDWMSQIPDNKSFFSLSIPGTHDSTMYNGYGISYAFGWQYALTQYYNFQDQLKLGIRAFDLRMQNDGKLVHGPVNSNQVFRDAIRDFATFLDKHPTEFIVARVKDEYFNVDKDWQAQQANKIYNDVLNEFEKYLYNPSGKSFWDLSDEGFNVEKFRGKIVILNHWHHKVNTSPRGGFMYKFVTSSQTVQDNYDSINSIDEKVKYVTQAMEKADNRNIHETDLHVNFLSMASGWRPFSSSQQVNPAVNKWLNEHNDLGTLGIVYMDYPGPALIQSVYRTNFNYKDDYLNNGGLGPLMYQISTDSVYEGDNTITINTSNNPSSYKNATFEIVVDEKTIKKIVVSAEFDSNNLIIELGPDYSFNISNKLKVLAYKLTPNYGWYEPKKYNKKELSIEILRDDLLHDKLSLIDKIKSTQRYYEQEYPQIYNYIDEKFIKRIQGLSRNQTNSRADLNDINSKWDLISQQMDSLIDDLANFSDSQNELKYTNLTSTFNKQNTNNITNFTKEINSELNSIFNPEESAVITVVKISNFSNKLKKYRWISKYLPTIVNDFKTLNIAKIKSDFENSFAEYDFAKFYWIQKLTEANNKPNEIFEELISKENPDEVMNLARNLSDKMSTDLSSLKLQIRKVNTILSVFSEYFKEENEILLPHFVDQIKEKIIDYWYNPDLTISEAESFKKKLNLLKKLTNDTDSFKERNNFMLNSSDKSSYLKLIEESNNALSDNNPDILNLQFIEEKISALNLVMQSISDSTKVYNQILSSFNNSQLIVAGHKKILKEKLDRLEIYTDSTTNEIKNEISSLISDNYVVKLKAFKNLNSPQSDEFLKQISITLNEKEINNTFTIYEILNQKMNELIIEKNKFNNLNTIKGFEFLNPTEQNDLKALLSTINEEMNHFIDTGKIDEFIAKLSKYDKIFNIDKTISDFNNLISDSSQLYQFEKNIFMEKLSSIKNFNEFNELKTAFKSRETANEPLKDKQTFTSFSKSQFAKAINDLLSTRSKQTYDEIKNKYLNLLHSINTGRNLINQNRNWFTQTEYINNYDASKREFKEKFDNLNRSLVETTDFNILDTEIQQFKTSISSLIENSRKYETEKQKETAYNNYLLDFEKLSSLINRNNPGSILSQTFNEITQQLNDNKIDLNTSLEVIIQTDSKIKELINKYELVIDELVNNYNEKQKVFNNYVKEFSFGVPEQKKTQLPSTISNDDLIEVNNNDSFKVTNLILTPYDENGTLLINYSIENNDFNSIKSQTINGFMNIAQFNYLKELSLKKQSLFNEIEKVKNLIDLLNDSIYSRIINDLNSVKTKYSNADSDNLSWYDDAITATKKAIKQAELNKTDIETKVLNKNIADANQLTKKINGYLNFVNRYAFDEFISNVSFFVKEMNEYKSILSKINLDSKPINEIEKKSQSSFENITQAGEKFISTKFNNLLSKVKFDVSKDLALKDIKDKDINISSPDELNVSIQSINKNYEDRSLNINFAASYKYSILQKNYLITDIRLITPAEEFINNIETHLPNIDIDSVDKVKNDYQDIVNRINDVDKLIRGVETKIPSVDIDSLNKTKATYEDIQARVTEAEEFINNIETHLPNIDIDSVDKVKNDYQDIVNRINDVDKLIRGVETKIPSVDIDSLNKTKATYEDIQARVTEAEEFINNIETHLPNIDIDSVDKVKNDYQDIVNRINDVDKLIRGVETKIPNVDIDSLNKTKATYEDIQARVTEGEEFINNIETHLPNIDIDSVDKVKNDYQDIVNRINDVDKLIRGVETKIPNVDIDSLNKTKATYENILNGYNVQKFKKESENAENISNNEEIIKNKNTADNLEKNNDKNNFNKTEQTPTSKAESSKKQDGASIQHITVGDEIQVKTKNDFNKNYLYLLLLPILGALIISVIFIVKKSKRKK
ncbi:hypothetical protein KQ874_02605 [Mycoplasma sp. ES3157-GEN-MYC]|uniref:hypothetical protein n=1 Tax=Mycoplasma miroungigenitalium TaxID=754515 RepID=UPI001C129035|nr:hypothetical protein [Mycoplasma miroungigenitalium]MBU4690570.1 hypothetical protein [Mycoplasma miroungigenitalium]